MVDTTRIEQIDPELGAALQMEVRRQTTKLELIASENFVSEAVREAAATVLTNKYAEGYPGARYYGGCEFVDIAEDLARERAKKLFAAEYANVQPHSGSQANLAVYLTVLSPGDTILGMDLAHGGHLTHGSKANISGKLYRIVSYGVRREDQRIDYDQVRDVARQEKPRLIIAGASAYPRTIDFARFHEIANEVGAFLMVDMAHIAGLVAAGEHPSPIDHADFVTTTTHKTLRGPRGGMILIGKDKENTMGVVAAKSGRTRNYSELVDSAVMPGVQGGPLMHIIAAKAVSFQEALQPAFAEYQKQIRRNATALAQSLTEAGATLMTGGTDNHLMLMDVSPFGLSGKQAEKLLDEANITVNKNGIPFDTRSPLVTSGVRLGTPALTTRGMREDDMRQVAGFILRVLSNPGDDEARRRVGEDVAQFCGGFPLVADSR